MTLEWIKNLLEFLKDEKNKFDKKYLWVLIKRAKEIMDKENNVEFINTSES